MMTRLVTSILVSFLSVQCYAQVFETEKTFNIPVLEGKAVGFFVSQTRLGIVWVKQDSIIITFKELVDSNPNPDPNPDPLPSGVVSMFWVEETLDRTPEQASMLSSKKVREAIVQKGLTFQVVDKDIKNEYGQTPSNLVPIISKVKNLPSLVLMDEDGSLTVYPIPTSEESFIKFLENIK